MSQSIGKCMQSLVAQVDGQKPVAGNLEVQYMAASGGNEDGVKGDDDDAAVRHHADVMGKGGDVSQQIMEVHGSRVKKYGIYCEQLVGNIKQVQNLAQDFFDIISQ